MVDLETGSSRSRRWAQYTIPVVLAMTFVIIPGIGWGQSYEDPASQGEPVQAGEPPADPNAAPPQEQGPGPNLKWEKFPAEFADYYTTQRMLADPIEPQPFCKSSRPLQVQSQLSYQMNAILDESGGTGTGYDTIYVDTAGTGDFSEMETYRLGQTDRKTGLEGHPLVSYFENVPVQRQRSHEGTIRVQMYIEENPDRVEGSEYLLNIIPAQWAVGKVEINGQPTPVAVVDGNFDDTAVSRRGANPYYVNQMAPGDDFAIVRGDYLIVGKPGETTLEPGDPNSWLGKTGSIRSLNTQYLVTDAGMFEIQTDESEGGVNLQLAPAQGVQTSVVDLSSLPSTTGRVAMYGTNACVVLDNHGSAVEVPGDTYYVPLFGAYTLEALAGQRAVLSPPPGVDASNVQSFNPLADRDQMIYTAEPPGGELGTTDAIRWAQARNNPFPFANQGSPGSRMVEIYVLEQGTNRPVAKASLMCQGISMGRMSRGYGLRRTVTDASGRCTIQLPADVQAMYATCQAPGYVPASMYWSGQGSQGVPAQFIWTAEKGTVIGGHVRDERGRPISGVQVMIVTSGGGRAGAPTPNLQQLAIRTDRRGKWRCDAAPAKLSHMMIGLTHPRFISDNFPNRTAKPEELRNEAAEMVMKEGITLTGKVTDAKDKPIVGATVNYGNFSPVKTDKKGQYKVLNLTTGRLIITARCSGHAPEQQTVKIEENMRPVNFRLEPGNLLRGRVVDQDGRSVSQAQVYLQSWRGTRNIFWYTKTDAQGRWSWQEAPADEAVFTIRADGYLPIEKIKLAPQRYEQVITVRSHLQVTGRVIDAETRQPIPSFTVTPGTTWNNVPGIYRWQDQAAATGTNGSFSLQLNELSNQYRLRIEAPGYLSTMSKAFSGEQGDPVLEISLRAEK